MYEEGEDDGLGYYPDGVERTLTDEQIAMFRHTEIQAIARELGQAQEGNASSGVCTPTSEDSDHRIKRTMAEFTPYGEGVKKRKLDLSGLMLRKRSHSALSDPEPGWEDIGTMREYEPEMTWDGPKKSGADAEISDSEEKLPRRIAREEDDLKVEEVDMDY
jgi:hypothetical protein